MGHMPDYKKLFRSKALRMRILKCLEWIPDEIMIPVQYYVKMGRLPNLKAPERYTEKLQWYKLYCRDPLMVQCSDKYTVRAYVRDCGLEHTLVPLYGVWERPEEIDFDALPERFVLKVSNRSHANLFVQNKRELDPAAIRGQLAAWMQQTEKSPGREWAYDGAAPRILCEAYLPADEQGKLPDYKFFCFRGQVCCLYYMEDRDKKGELRAGIFDPDFVQLPAYIAYDKRLEEPVTKPENFEEMLKIAQRLSQSFLHVRVDLYNLKGRIYFGELTFYTASGFTKYEPDRFDLWLGEHFLLPQKGEEAQWHIKKQERGGAACKP